MGLSPKFIFPHVGKFNSQKIPLSEYLEQCQNMINKQEELIGKPCQTLILVVVYMLLRPLDNKAPDRFIDLNRNYCFQYYPYDSNYQFILDLEPSEGYNIFGKLIDVLACFLNYKNRLNYKQVQTRISRIYDIDEHYKTVYNCTVLFESISALTGDTRRIF